MLGERLKELRKKRNLKQEEVAEAINISRQAYAKWETNGAEPSVSFLIELAKFFNVSIDYICGYTDVKASYYKDLRLCRYVNKCIEIYDEFLI